MPSAAKASDCRFIERLSLFPLFSIILDLTCIAPQSYRKSGKKFFIDCGAAGMFELA